LQSLEPAINLYSSVRLLGAAHGVFLALALINTTTGNIQAHRLLTLTFAADLGIDFHHQSRYLILFPKLTYVEDVTSFFYGPMACLYVLALTSTDWSRVAQTRWLHFLPAGLSVLLLVPHSPFAV